MEINDVLTDPCPQCALKHLSAALEYAFDMKLGGWSDHDTALREAGWSPNTAGTRLDVLLALAIINLVEVAEGYASHKDYAVGLLVRLEETLASATTANGEEDARSIRETRVRLMAGEITAGTAARQLRHGLSARVLFPKSFMYAHLLEASRELPLLNEVAGQMSFSDIDADLYDKAIDAILKRVAWVRGQFFDDAQPAQTGGDTNDQG